MLSRVSVGGGSMYLAQKIGMHVSIRLLPVLLAVSTQTVHSVVIQCDVETNQIILIQSKGW